MINPKRYRELAVCCLLIAAGAGLFPTPGLAQNIVRVGNVSIQPDQVPPGWTLISDTSMHDNTLTGKNAGNLTNEVLTRIQEVQLETSLSSVWTQKFETGGKLVEIQYYGGVAEEDTAKAYSEIARQGLADAVVHKGRFAVAIRSRSPSLVRTAIGAIGPAPLDRIKILDVSLPRGEKTKTELLANRFQRENLGNNFGILPEDVLNQFFEGEVLRQVTYVACATVEDASRAAGPLRRMSKGKSRILAEGRYLVEIVGDDSWATAAERMILPRLLEVVARENESLEAAREDVPTEESRDGTG